MMSKLTRVAIVLAIGAFTLTGLPLPSPRIPSSELGAQRREEQVRPGPTPKSVTSTYEAAGKGYKVSVRNEPASGPVQQYPTPPTWMARTRK